MGNMSYKWMMGACCSMYYLVLRDGIIFAFPLAVPCPLAGLD